MASEEVQAKVMEWMRQNSQKEKKKFYVKDVVVGLPDVPKAEVKLAVAELTTNGQLRYWSTGSTTMLTLPEFFPAE